MKDKTYITSKTNQVKVKPDKVFLNFVLVVLIAFLFLEYHLLFSRIWFRIPVEDCEEGFCETISELCIFNPFRDKTLENKIQKMIDYIKEKDPKKASKILEELKNDKQISPRVINDLIDYREIRDDMYPYLDKIKPRDYFKKKDKIIFAFYVLNSPDSPYYNRTFDHVCCYGIAYIDSKTKKIEAVAILPN